MTENNIHFSSLAEEMRMEFSHNICKSVGIFSLNYFPLPSLRMQKNYHPSWEMSQY